ncbi:MAG TPA: bifunctional 4-hydroxy-2-oxoglutarate aldolase/2-dehydro-3-deoxy-phosphogluconate aldolase [Hanamia sp.]
MNAKNQFSWKSFETMPVIGIMRNVAPKIIETIVPLYQKADLTTLEITMNSDEAPQIIRSLSAQYPDLNIGGGTVLEMADLESAIEAGASFIVTPILNEEVITYCVQNEIPVFPGALTPTEVYKAWKLGASAVKVFPATQFGTAYLKELKGPLSKINLLPTGGVSIQNIEGFFKAGAVGVGMGSTLFDKKLILKRDFEGLYSHFESLSFKVRRIRNSVKN